jgi:hypothetical protein
MKAPLLDVEESVRVQKALLRRHTTVTIGTRYYTTVLIRIQIFMYTLLIVRLCCMLDSMLARKSVFDNIHASAIRSCAYGRASESSRQCLQQLLFGATPS